MEVRNIAVTVFGFAVAAAVLAILTIVVGTDAVVAALREADPGGVSIVAAAIISWVCLWGAGLRVVLAAVGPRVALRDAILVNAGAAFANHVTPFGQAGGEPVAAWLLADAGNVDIEDAFAAIASFDAINVIPSLALAGIGLAYYTSVATLGPRFRLIAIGLGLIGLVLVSVILLIWRRRGAVETTVMGLLGPPVRALGRIIPRREPPDTTVIADRISAFIDGLERVAADRRRLAVALAFSTAGWLAQAAGLWVALSAVGASIAWYIPLFVVPMGTVASALPTPGGLGGIESLQVALLLAATGANAATLTAAVAVFSVGGFLLTTSVGAAAVAVLRVRTDQIG